MDAAHTSLVGALRSMVSHRSSADATSVCPQRTGNVARATSDDDTPNTAYEALLEGTKGAMKWYGARLAVRAALNYAVPKVVDPASVADIRIDRMELFVLSTTHAGYTGALSFKSIFDNPAVLFAKEHTAAEDAPKDGEVGADTTAEPPSESTDVTGSQTQEEQQVRRTLRANSYITRVMLGYMLHDLYAIAPEWRLYPLDIVHHVTGIAMLLKTILEPAVLKISAGFCIMETTTVMLNSMWMLREMKVAPVAQRRLGILFAIAFFLLRIVWFPAYLGRLITSRPKDWSTMGTVAQRALYANLGLQFYWFYQILQNIVGAAS